MGMEKEQESGAATALRKEPEHDVIILGAGIAGSIPGAAPARQAGILIAAAGAHSRFAVGESMIPYTPLGPSMLAERSGVPEIATPSSHKDRTKEISASFGRKRDFGFIRHAEGNEPGPRDSHRFNILEFSTPVACSGRTRTPTRSTPRSGTAPYPSSSSVPAT